MTCKIATIPLKIPPATSTTSAGIKILETKSISFDTIPLGAAGGASLVGFSLRLVNCMMTLNTSATLLPITTWNCPPLCTTVMIPACFFKNSAFAFDSSFNANLSLVAQCTRLIILSLPPTCSIITSASCLFFIAYPYLSAKKNLNSHSIGSLGFACIKK